MSNSKVIRKGKMDDTVYNRNLAHSIFEEFPHVKEIVEHVVDNFGICYAIYDILEWDNQITFYMHQSGQIDTSHDFKGKKVVIQIGYIEAYAFSVTIWK